jgi:hypothetical protein
MSRRFAAPLFVALACAIGAISGALWGSQSPVRAQNTQESEARRAGEVEEIYIARSVRESRATPTEFCATASTRVVDPTFEDQYTFRSIAIRTSDGRVVDTNVKTIGSIHACFGRTANPAISQFFADIVFDRIAFKGLGECPSGKPDFPEKGVRAARCFLDFYGLPNEYVGGQLTTSTMVSLKVLGTESDPPGYTQPSIATIRLWKKR